MKRVLILCSLSLFPLPSLAQQVKGKLYGPEVISKYVKVSNASKNIKTYTDHKGNFKIKADWKDTLVLNSPFYAKKILVVDSIALNEGFKVYVGGRAVDLGQVLVRKKREIDNEKFTAHINANYSKQLKNDFKNRPYLYKPINTENGDLIALGNFIIGEIVKLFKRNDENHQENGPSVIIFEDLENLFRRDSLFNDRLLENELKIPRDKKYLFFSFCEDHNLDPSLLKPDKEFLLLDQLMKQAAAFRKRSKK